MRGLKQAAAFADCSFTNKPAELLCLVCLSCAAVKSCCCLLAAPLESSRSLSSSSASSPGLEALMEVVCAVFEHQSQVGEDIHELEGLLHLELTKELAYRQRCVL